ncbi:MAG: hypothetical protein KAH31_01420 [Candidatus Sabulitectum sp.]|nr:hypothetical protein [Candidatus Sabulitectum sp.]
MKSNAGITLTGAILLAAPVVYADASDVQSVIESEDWETLKDIWEIIDQIKPADRFSVFPIAGEKGDSLRTVIDTLLLESAIEDPHLQSAIRLIKRITATRIMHLSRINISLITRMMPPWTEIVQDNQLYNFEERITILSDLVESGEITAVEFAAARDTLMERAETWAMLEILQDVRTHRNYDYDGWQPEIVDTDLVLERLDMSYRAALDTLNKAKLSVNTEYFQTVVLQHEQFMERYDEFAETKPVLRILLMDLIDPETMQ